MSWDLSTPFLSPSLVISTTRDRSSRLASSFSVSQSVSQSFIQPFTQRLTMSTCLRDKVIGHWLHIIPGGGCVELWLGTNRTQPFTNLSWQSLHVPSSLCPRVLAMQLKQTRGSGGWMHGGICCNPKRLFYVCSMMIVNSVHDPSSILLLPVPSSRASQQWGYVGRQSIMKNHEPTKIWLSITILFA